MYAVTSQLTLFTLKTIRLVTYLVEKSKMTERQNNVYGPCAETCLVRVQINLILNNKNYKLLLN